MANEKNLIPQAHTLTVEEASKGGQNSVKARGLRMDLVLGTEVSSSDRIYFLCIAWTFGVREQLFSSDYWG